MTSPFEISPIFDWNFNCNKPIVVNQGGTSSGKTYSLLQVLFCKAAETPKTVITVVGQDIPNLKVGAIRDFETILNSSSFFSSFISNINKTDKIYQFNNGSIIEFKSYENEQDAKNGKRDYLFVNEANGVSYAVYDQLQVRTSKQVFLDYNPTAPFWVHENLIGRKDVQLFISNYKHNPFLNDEIKRKILKFKDTDPEKWQVYGLGRTGKTEGVIFNNVNWVSDFPKDIKRYCFGMDFGFSADPTTLIKCGISDGELFAQRWLYEHSMTTNDIHKALLELGFNPKDIIIADSADPKTIKELRLLGWKVRPSKKGADSIRHGIDAIKKYNALNIVNCQFWKKEQVSYVWGIDRKTSKPTNKPIDDFNHLWDSLRYGIQGLSKKAARTIYRN
jgi:phage terminase large subunit